MIKSFQLNRHRLTKRLGGNGYKKDPETGEKRISAKTREDQRKKKSGNRRSKARRR